MQKKHLTKPNIQYDTHSQQTKTRRELPQLAKGRPTNNAQQTAYAHFRVKTQCFPWDQEQEEATLPIPVQHCPAAPVRTKRQEHDIQNIQFYGTEQNSPYSQMTWLPRIKKPPKQQNPPRTIKWVQQGCRIWDQHKNQSYFYIQAKNKWKQ